MPTNFSSSRFRFGFEFSVLARQWRRTIDKCLERAGLSDTTWAPLIHLQEAGDGISQKDLAALDRIGKRLQSVQDRP